MMPSSALFSLPEYTKYAKALLVTTDDIEDMQHQTSYKTLLIGMWHLLVMKKLIHSV